MIDLKHSPLDPFVDWCELESRVDGDCELIHELFELFQETFPQVLVDLKSATAHGEVAGIQLAAHTIKGMLANLSFNKVVLLAASIEDAARHADMVTIRKAVAAFVWETEPILPAVQAFTEGLQQ